MELQTLAEISPVLQTTAVALLIFAVGAFFQKLNYRAKLAKLPALGGDVTREKRRQIYLAGAIKDYAEGYQKVAGPRLAQESVTDKTLVQEQSLPHDNWRW